MNAEHFLAAGAFVLTWPLGVAICALLVCAYMKAAMR